MSNEMITVGEANNGELVLSITVLKTWTPKNISYIGATVFFKNEKTYYSMTRENFKKIYNI
jgi:hypothetical protein